MYQNGNCPQDRFDVVVVGGGAAGLLAALAVADSGATVVLLEKNSEVGGKTVWSAGLVTAGGTVVQAERRVEDSVDAHRREILAHAERTGVLGIPGVSEKLGLLIDNVADAVDRLAACGVRFGGPHPEEMHSVARGHQFVPGARAAIAALAQKTAEAGVRIRRDTPVDELITGPTGSILGVRAGGREIRANAVILSAGDFSAAGPGRPAPQFAEHAYKSWATGDGQHLAAEAGGDLVGVDSMVFAALITVDEPLFFAHPHVLAAGAIVVDGTGRRIANETVTFGHGYAERTPHDLYLVVGGDQLAGVATSADDGPVGRDGWLRTGKSHLGNFGGVGYAYVDDLLDAGHAVRGESLDHLAATLGMDAATLRREAAEIAKAVGAEDRLGRSWSTDPFANGPFLAVGPMRGAVALGAGGIRCDERMRALDSSGEPIDGLYVAGDCADSAGAGFITGGHGYGLGWAFASGLIAGRDAAASTGASAGRPAEAANAG
ncbi:hypothetical protein GCM10017786_08250 [Amycolatopsis deserti]|uniref:FAD-dependent oxidoreductase 2 FAD-binding domain-containing protein n=1 Tax=Amycolatopsis deserti TaxID=185696 RepID=A0ABQ3IIM6_9PSEU|nr:FAD-dependent oxidoreductase [Amycolatopsis deserti]GHE80471.1 hypothetical protein GCM10017786_08250 [Amycolatopsis deserti]